VNCGRFCFWRRQSVVFLFVYEISPELLKDLHQIHTEDVFIPLLGGV